MFEALGGQSVIDKLVDDFYEIMRTDVYAQDCLAAHQGKDLRDSAHKLKYFLSGWLGGPQLYLEKFGHPRLRMRHFPFAIGEKEGEQWLYCMKKALDKSVIARPIQVQMLSAFEGVVKQLKNKN
jgi:hemoglobin